MLNGLTIMRVTPNRKGLYLGALGGLVNWTDRQTDRRNLLLGESGGYAPRDLKVALGGLRRKNDTSCLSECHRCQA